MFDPITISASVSVASAAFSNIKRMFQAGRDLEAMSQDLSRWMGAVSDVDNAHKSAKNPSMLRKVFGGGSVEQEAIEAFTAKKKLEERAAEIEVEKTGEAGTILDDKMTIACAKNAVQILELKKEGKKQMLIDEYLKGNEIKIGQKIN